MENEQSEISPVNVPVNAQDESQAVKSQEKSYGKLALICLVTSIAGGMIGVGIFQPSMMAVFGVAVLITGLVIAAFAAALSKGRW